MATSLDLAGNGPKTPQELRQLHLFNDVADEVLEEVFALLRRTKFKNRATSMVERDFHARVAFVWSGEYRVGVTTPHGETVTMYGVKPRDAFGFAVALAGHSFGDAHRLFVDRGGVIVDIPTDYFLSLSDKSAAFAKDLTRTLVTHALNYGARVYELAAGNARNRLLAELIRHAHLVPGGDRRRLNPSPTQASLAALIGATREGVSRQLHALKEEGVIELDRGKITIVSLGALQKMDERAMGRRLFLPYSRPD